MGPAPRLLYLVNETHYFSTHWLAVAAAAKAAGCEVHVAAPFAAEGVAAIAAAGLRYHPIPLERRSLSPWGELRLLAAIFALERRLKPDLVHHLTMKPVVWGGLAARAAQVPAAVFSINGLGHLFLGPDLGTRLLRALVTPLYRLSLGHRRSRTVFQNPDDRALFLKLGLVGAARAEQIKGSGVDLTRFRPRPEPDGPPVVLLPARLLAEKGVNEFVAAAKMLRGQGVAGRFALAGRIDPGNPSAIAEATIRAWVAVGTIEWWGHRGDMPEALAEAAIVCLPSYREGTPRALIEASAVGRAIVATDVPGCREIVRDGVNGLLVPARDAAALAQALRRVIEDKALRRELAAAGQRIAVSEFSAARFHGDILAIYRDLLPAGALP